MSQATEADEARRRQEEKRLAEESRAREKAQARATARARVEAQLDKAKSMAESGDVDGAVAYLMGLLETEPPSALFSARLVWFLLRERRFAEARAALDQLQATAERVPGLRSEVAVLELEYRLFTHQLDGIEAHAAVTEAQYPGHETIRALHVIALLIRGEHDRAATLLNAVPPIGEGALDRTMRLFHLLDLPARLAVADYALSQPGFTLKAQAAKMVLVLLQHDRVGDARQFAERVLAAGAGRSTPFMRLLAARAAHLAGDPQGAAAHMAQLVGEAHPELMGESLETLRVLFRGVASKHDLQTALSSLQQKMAPDVEPGYVQRRIDEYLSRPPEERFADKNFERQFFTFAVACSELQQMDLLHAEMLRIPDHIHFSLADLRRLLRFHGVVDDDAVRERVRQQLLRTINRHSQEGLLYRMLLHPPGETLDEPAADCLDHLESGCRSWDLRLYLAEEWPELRLRIQSPAIVQGLARQVENAFDPAFEATNLSLVNAQRHLVETMAQGLGAPPEVKVSIITPCHRLGDLPNLRRCVGWQSWPDLELIVVANGPLAGNPAVREALAGLDQVTVLHAEARSLGGVLNLALDAAAGDVVMRFDSDDLYFEDYVRTTVQFIHGFQVDLAGKASIFYCSERMGRTFFSQKGNYLEVDSDIILGYSGSTMCMTKQVARDFRFPEDVTLSEDILFYNAARQRGCRFLTLDPFNHVVLRRAAQGHHTWRTAVRLVSHTDLLPVGGVAAVAYAATGDRPHARIGAVFGQG